MEDVVKTLQELKAHISILNKENLENKAKIFVLETRVSKSEDKVEDLEDKINKPPEGNACDVKQDKNFQALRKRVGKLEEQLQQQQQQIHDRLEKLDKLQVILSSAILRNTARERDKKIEEISSQLDSVNKAVKDLKLSQSKKEKTKQAEAHSSTSGGKSKVFGSTTSQASSNESKSLEERKGTSDGMYKDKRYFSTPANYAIFTPLHKIQTRRDGWSKRSRLRADADSEGLYRAEQPNSYLKLGERIVWISDDGAKRGTVRWCGVLPDDSVDNVTVGVEFDEPIGTGTGKYKDKRLFYARQNHASLIPLMELMREEEYENPIRIET